MKCVYCGTISVNEPRCPSCGAPIVTKPASNVIESVIPLPLYYDLLSTRECDRRYVNIKRSEARAGLGYVWGKYTFIFKPFVGD